MIHVATLLCCYVSVVNPSTGAVLGTVPDMGEAEARSAVNAAYKAFQTWKDTTAKVSSLFYLPHLLYLPFPCPNQTVIYFWV